MIAKLTVGNGLRGAVTYDLRPKKGEPNRAEWVCGTLGGIGATPQQISRQGGLLRALRPEIKNPIWRCSLSLPPSEGRKDSAFWKQIVEEFLLEMEIPLDAGWLAVRHDDVAHDHIHLSVVRILNDSTLWNRANDLPKAVKATQKLEQRHGLAAHSREKPKKSLPTLADRQISKRKIQPMPKPFVQNEIDSIFSEHKNGLPFEKLRALLAPKGVELDEKRTKQGKLQGLSFKCQGIAFPASALGSEYSTSGLIKRGLIVNEQLELTKNEPEDPKEQQTASKMPAMLKPMLLPSQYSAKQIKPYAAHQTDVTLNSEKFNSEVVNLQVGPAAKVMLIIGGLLAQSSVFLIEKIIAFLKRLLAFFGYGLRASDLQKYQHPDKAAPALCYEPTQLALPATKSTEDKCSDELFRIAQSLETNDPSLLPILDDEEASKARAEVVAAMENQGDQGAGVTTSNAENFGFTDDDFASTNPVAEPPKPDPLDDLKEALAAYAVAARELKIAETKNGPIHFSTVVQRQAELKIVREDVEFARAKWDQFCTEHPFKSSLPSSEKKRLQDSVKANEEVEKRAKKAVATAEAEDARIAKLYAALPAAVVPPAILQSEFQARQSVKTAREAIQIEALAAIKAIRSDIMMSPKMAKFESLFESSFKQFNRTGEISADEISVLASQISELRRLQNAQEAARRAALAVYDEDADQPVIDGQIVK